MKNELKFDASIDKDSLLEQYKHNMTELIEQSYQCTQDYSDRSLLIYGVSSIIYYNIYFGNYLILQIYKDIDTYRLTIGSYVRFTADKIVIPDKDWSSIKFDGDSHELCKFSKEEKHMADFIFPYNSYIIDSYKYDNLYKYSQLIVGDADGISDEDKLIKIGYINEYKINLVPPFKLPVREVRHTRFLTVDYDISQTVSILDDLFEWVKPVKVEQLLYITLILKDRSVVIDLDEIKVRIERMAQYLYDTGLKIFRICGAVDGHSHVIYFSIPRDNIDSQLTSFFNTVKGQLDKV